MKYQMRILQGLKLAAVLAVALSMGACANKNAWRRRRHGKRGHPGQPAGFRGQCRRPRVLRKRPDRSDAAGDRHAGKAGAVAADLQPLRLHHRRPCRRARNPRIQHCARRAARPVGAQPILASRGIDPNRMRTISYGKERPVAVCNDISCWSQNRRAVTVLNASS